MSRRVFAVGIAALFAAVCALAPAADASLVRALDLAELTALADRVVVADVLSVDAAWDGAHRTIHTTVELGVQEHWKGDAPAGGRLIVRQLGGTVGDIEMTVVGAATFVSGERSVLFLRRGQVVGMAQGKRRVHWQPGPRRWRVEPAQLAALLGVDARGGLHPAARDAAEDLDELRARVAKLVGRQP